MNLRRHGMRILFVFLYSGVPQFPIGIGSISSVLKEGGHETGLCPVEWRQSSDSVTDRVRAWQPEVIGFTSMSSMFTRIREISLSLRRWFPGLFQVCGGIHPTVVPKCIEEAPFDAICRGEGEYGLLELVDRLSQSEDYRDVEGFWFNQGGETIENPVRRLIQDLDRLPMPDHHIYQSCEIPGRIEGQGEFMFCRGCPFDCTYCSNHALRSIYRGQNYVRYPSVEKAMEELLWVKKRYHTRHVVIHDDIFSLNRKWFYDFCEEYKRRIHLPFFCCIRPGTCTQEMFRALKDANCQRVSIGVESGNPYIREKILNRRISDGEIVKTFRLAREAGLETSSFIMLGLPHETREALVDTVRLTARLGAQNKTQGYIFHPYPETRLEKLCREQGWEPARSLGSRERLEAVLNLPSISPRDIQAYYDYFNTLVKVERLALAKGKHSIARLVTRLFVLPRLFFLVRLYYRAHKAGTYGFIGTLRRLRRRLLPIRRPRRRKLVRANQDRMGQDLPGLQVRRIDEGSEVL